MSAMASRAAATGSGRKKISPSPSIFFLNCGGRDAEAVSVSPSHPGTADDGHASSPSGRPHSSSSTALSARPETSSTDTITLTATSTDEVEEDNSSFSDLLRQLDELEQHVAAWDCPIDAAAASRPSSRRPWKKGKTRKCRSVATVGDIAREAAAAWGVSTETKGWGRSWPSSSRRRTTRRATSGGSMLQMIVEKEIVGREELRELLRRFLVLNSSAHHPIIIRAFADIWRDVFFGYGDVEDDPILLRLLPFAAGQRHPRRQPRLRRNTYHRHRED